MWRIFKGQFFELLLFKFLSIAETHWERTWWGQGNGIFDQGQFIQLEVKDWDRGLGFSGCRMGNGEQRPRRWEERIWKNWWENGPNPGHPLCSVHPCSESLQEAVYTLRNTQNIWPTLSHWFLFLSPATNIARVIFNLNHHKLRKRPWGSQSTHNLSVH